MLRSIILFALALYLPLLNSGQELCYEHYPLAPVINILDTGEEVWMTTRGDGVFRFDKTNNTTEQFTNGEAGLNSDYCHDLIYYNGHLLISTDSVVYAFDNGQFVTHLDSIGGAMAISSEGRLIVASGERYTEWDDGTIYYEKDLFELGPEGLQLSCGICDMSSDITIDDEGRVWISHFGFYEFDILRYDGLEWLVFDHQSVGSDVLPIESFDHRNQIFAHDGSIWASSWIGLNKEFNGEWELYHNPGSMNWGIVNSTDTLATYPLALTRDTEGALWIGSISSEWTAEASQLASFIDDEWQVFDGLPDFNGFNCLS
ncbi:MAG: hypothetical protein HKO93_05930, partial [Flavobacteriales bacterium]|nr:hypothetical protein [Flavobacteriales bacterium]